MRDVIEREQWAAYLKDFSRRNQLRATRVEVLGDGDIGAQEEGVWLPLTGASAEMEGKDAPRVEIMLGGETEKEERHLTRIIRRVRSIMRKTGTDGREEALLIEDEDGTRTLLRFEALPELGPAA